jgi:hypothetical protein
MKLDISLGEVLDRHCIASLKTKYISDPGKLQNVQREREAIIRSLKGLKLSHLTQYIDQLYEVNEQLWYIEDRLREKESESTFDEEFLELSRSRYKANDRRYSIKRQINLLSGSSIVEEKQYPKYKDIP